MEDFDFKETLGKSFLITKIVNDSIKDGTKSVALSLEDVKNDYKYVDVLNGETGTNDWSQYDNDTSIYGWGN